MVPCPGKGLLQEGCLPVALAELKEHKKAFIVTDQFLYQNGYTKPVETQLDAMGIIHTTFFDVAPDPTLACAKEGAARMREFQPDLIIAIGGGSARTPARSCGFSMSIPKLTSRIWPCVSWTSASGCTPAPDGRESLLRGRAHHCPAPAPKSPPFAVITDEVSGVKYPLADYELLPKMAIIDADMMMNAPRGLTAASGIDAVTHALEAYASMMATVHRTAWPCGA